MDEIKRLLPNYKFGSVVNNLVRVDYKDIVTHATVNNILLNINKWKYMHDNWIYLEELIIANGYVQRFGNFEKEGTYPRIEIWFTGVSITKNANGGHVYYNNLDTLFSDLREFFGSESLNKPVISKIDF